MSTSLHLTDLDRLLELVPPLRMRYCPLRPTPRQEAFLRLANKEVFFGGAAGGGKSVAMLMAAVQFADVPGYHALLLRPSITELQLAGGLIELSHEWLATSKARWSGDTKTWRFPGNARSGAGGATLTFGYLADAADLERYAGSGYSMLGFDELTRFDETHYRRMFRALRQATGIGRGPRASDGTTLADVPPRVRATSNPGGPGHAWVKERFVDPATRHPEVVYLASRIDDNPHLDTNAYRETLGELPTAERERLLHGDWRVPDDGELFRGDWFELIERHQLPPDGCDSVRAWDLAATEPNPGNRDPDWTVGLRLDWHRPSGTFYVSDIVRERRGPGAIEQLVKNTAERDGRAVPIVIEQEPGAAGVLAADRFKRHVLPSYIVKTQRATGEKLVRARPAAAAAETGLVKLVRSRHTQALLEELTAFPHGKHDDCVDALACAHTTITTYGGPGSISIPDDIPIDLPAVGADTWNPQRYPRDCEGEYLSALLGIPLHPAPPPGLTPAPRGRR